MRISKWIIIVLRLRSSVGISHLYYLVDFTSWLSCRWKRLVGLGLSLSALWFEVACDHELALLSVDYGLGAAMDHWVKTETDG